MFYLYLLVLIVLLLILFTSISAAPWVPTRKFDINELLDDVGIKNGIKYTELGCGDGRLVKAAAKQGAHTVGYELNPILFMIAWLNNLGIANSRIIYKNFWNVDLSKTDVVMVFIMPRTLPRLDKKLRKELKSGSLVVSYIFPIVGKKEIHRGKSWYVYRYGKQPNETPDK